MSEALGDLLKSVLALLLLASIGVWWGIVTFAALKIVFWM